MESYEELSNPLSCLIILVYFFLPLEAMNDSALEKLKRETRERKLERKIKATRKEQVERERVEQVHLIRAISIEPLVLCEPTTWEFGNF